MAPVTTSQLLYELRRACYRSSLVSYVEEQTIDSDVLKTRVHLTPPHTFISAFYNVTTNKVAFALIEKGKRTYGVDNAKISWHKHPFDNPDQHLPCPPMQFDEFLDNVENHFERQKAEGVKEAANE